MTRQEQETLSHTRGGSGWISERIFPLKGWSCIEQTFQGGVEPPNLEVYKKNLDVAFSALLELQRAGQSKVGLKNPEGLFQP